LAPFTGIYFGDLKGNIGTLTINYKEIIGPIANRNHFSIEHCSIKQPWPFNLIISTPIIPACLLTQGNGKSDDNYTV
jgi:hypothetical protein